MNKNSQRTWLLITVLFAFALTTFCLGKIVTEPWHFVPQLGADGGKNTFSFLYHILYDRGFWFTGMNYPYGENIVFTDGQPTLSVPLGYFRHVTIGQGLTVLWWLVALSYVLSIVYLYKILLHFRLRPFIAMLFAGLIGIFTPQIFSLQGHYGLAYCCVVPMIFYWTIKYNNNPKWKYPFYISLLGFITSFLHPYYAPEVMIFIGCYSAGYLLFTRLPFALRLKHVLPLLVGLVLLFGSIGMVMKLTDPVTDRPTTPYGMLVYCATGNQILTSTYSPLWRLASAAIPSIHPSEFAEGYCYPGVVVICTVVFSVVFGIIKKRRKKEGDNVVNKEGYNPIWLFIAVFSLLFAMGVPFMWHMEWLVNYVSVFRQFRTLGRFSWIFYYLITVYGVVVINAWFSKLLSQKRQTTAYLLLAGTIAIWTIEAGGYVQFEKSSQEHSEENYEVVNGDKDYNWTHFLEEHHYHSTDFQALLILRFFVCGMDKLWLGRDVSQIGVAKGLEAGVQLHLPWIDNMMARSSWSQTEKQVKIAGGPYVHKPLLDELTDNKPFLLLHIKEEDLEPDQQYLLEASDSIGQFRGCNIYACYPERIRTNDKKHADSIRALLPFLTIGDTCLRNTGTWYVNHFDTGRAPGHFFGTGAISQIMPLKTVVAKVPVVHTNDSVYEFSCWFLLGNENYKSPFFKIELLDSNDNPVAVYDALTKESTDNHGLWFRTYAFFPVTYNCSSVRCILINEPDNTYKIMDELMIRPADALIISKAADGSVLVNNHLFPDKSIAIPF